MFTINNPLTNHSKIYRIITGANNDETCKRTNINHYGGGGQLEPTLRADLRTDGAKRVRIASAKLTATQLSQRQQRAWSKYKTADFSLLLAIIVPKVFRPMKRSFIGHFVVQKNKKEDIYEKEQKSRTIKYHSSPLAGA